MGYLHDHRVEQVFDVLGSNPYTVATTKMLSRNSGISPTYFRRIFQKNVGVLPSSFLRDLKLGQAYKDLMFTDDPIIEISTRSGFAFQSAFSRAFKEQFGLIPKQVRFAATDRARRIGPKQALGPDPQVLRMKPTTMLRRVYLSESPDANPPMGEGYLGDVAWKDIAAELTEKTGPITYLKKKIFVPMRPRYMMVNLIFVDPDEVRKSPTLRQFFADRISYKPIFEDEFYLGFATGHRAAANHDHITESIASWVRNQSTYTISNGEWVEKVTLGPDGSVDLNLYVPLSRTRHFEPSDAH